jgi:PD-(D/E)XK nuclease superfamily
MTPEQASEKYKWCKYDKDTNTVELYLDHYMLSCLRTCEAKFYLEHLLNVKPKKHLPMTEVDTASETGQVVEKVYRKPWFFDFGEFIHWCLEHFYNSYKTVKSAPPVDTWLFVCKTKWLTMRMDEYKNSIIKADITKYEEVKGWEGVCGLLCQYYAYFMDMRLRVIDTEITFGHNKEVNIGNFWLCEPYTAKPNPIICRGIDLRSYKVECYLTGRIDLLVDNGYKIGPVDHKTTHRFDGYEHEDFNPHDAMTGYILAIHEILNKLKYSSTDLPIASCRGGWIYHIQATTPSQPRDKSKQPGPRFKTTPVDKTISQLEDFKKRQLSTFRRVAELLFNDKVPEWNTTNCNNMFFRKCEYKPIHEQPSEQWQDIIDRFYTIGPAWDTRDHSSKDTTKEKDNIIC